MLLQQHSSKIYQVLLNLRENKTRIEMKKFYYNKGKRYSSTFGILFEMPWLLVRNSQSRNKNYNTGT